MDLKDWGIVGIWISTLGGLVWKAARQDKQISDNKEEIGELKESYKDCVKNFKEEVKTGQTLIMSKLETMSESLGDVRERVANIEGRMDRNGQ